MSFRFSLVRIKNSKKEPLTLSEVKEYLRVYDDTEDALISQLIKTARQWVESYTGSSLLEQTWELHVFPKNPPSSSLLSLVRPSSSPPSIRLPQGPILSVEKLYFQRGLGPPLLLEDSEYEIQQTQGHCFIYPHLSYWYGFSPLRIRYTAGYGKRKKEIPSPLRQALFIQIANLYENRGDDPTSQTISPLFFQLLQPYRFYNLSS